MHSVFTQSTLRISSWNINGFNSKHLGNKLCDHDFLTEIQGDDIVGISETHIHEGNKEKLAIPGFKRVAYKCKILSPRMNKGFGGIALFAKEHIFKYLTPQKNENEDTIWVKLKKEFLKTKEDIFIATVYMNPPKQRGEDEIRTQVFEEEVLRFNRQGKVLIQGDLNARTNSENDFIPPETFELSPDPIDRSELPNRNSLDKGKTDSRGTAILDICKSQDLSIVNGRKPGDIYGAFTSIQWKGSSVVDYIICSRDLFDTVCTMRVGNYIPWLSDHCALHFEIKSQKPEAELEGPERNTQVERVPKIIWREGSSEKFSEILSKNDKRLNDLNELESVDSAEFVSLFSEIMTDTLGEAGLKSRPSRRGNAGNNPPWFDKECRKAKLEVRMLGNLIKRRPNCTKTREDLFRKKKGFKNLVNKKKREYKQNVINDMGLSKNNSKKFWKLLEKLNPTKHDKDFTNKIPELSWINHFKKTLIGTRTPQYPNNCMDEGPLDHDITFEELKEASYILKPGKASGIDGISNDMIYCVFLYKPSILLKLFNLALKHNGDTPDWYTAILAPIHKKGTRTDPTNYRGISLICCLNKFFAAILNNRLVAYTKEKNILSDEQLGFVKGNRTSDAHLILHNLIQEYCHKQGKFIYSCLVDFKKAFDSIPRDTLFQKLIGHGITGKFFNVLRNMYTNDSIRIKVGDTLSNIIHPNQGVRQGCILSPTLFNIFLADLPKALYTPENRPIKLDDQTSLSCIIWADDLVMFSQSEEGLKNMISTLASYTEENSMEINPDKTKCMIFNKTGRLIRRTFKYKGSQLEIVREYKYLGFILTPSGEITTGLKDLKDRANRASNCLRTKLGDSFRKDIRITLKLFKALVQPILLYMADFWGCLPMPKNNPIEVMQNKFLKQLLGVQTQTSTIGILLETGEIPISCHGKQSCVKNWARITRNLCNGILKKSISNSTSKDLKWTSKIRENLAAIGLFSLFLTTSSSTSKTDNIFIQRITDIFHQKSLAEIRDPEGKLRTYSKLKTESGFENYLVDVTSITDRTNLTKLRLSNHVLMIEKGRHVKPKKIDKDKRFCHFCSDKVEDEEHFLMSCAPYRHIRSRLFERAQNIKRDFRYRTDEEKFTWLLSVPELSKDVAKYISNAFEIREFLMSRPKSTD